MIEKFNGIIYLIIFIIHFVGIAIYAFQTIVNTRKFCEKFEIDDTAFVMVRFVGAFMMGWVAMAIYIMFIRNNGDLYVHTAAPGTAQDVGAKATN